MLRLVNSSDGQWGRGLALRKTGPLTCMPSENPSATDHGCFLLVVGGIDEVTSMRELGERGRAAVLVVTKYDSQLMLLLLPR